MAVPCSTSGGLVIYERHSGFRVKRLNTRHMFYVLLCIPAINTLLVKSNSSNLLTNVKEGKKTFIIFLTFLSFLFQTVKVFIKRKIKIFIMTRLQIFMRLKENYTK